MPPKKPTRKRKVAKSTPSERADLDLHKFIPPFPNSVIRAALIPVIVTDVGELAIGSREQPTIHRAKRQKVSHQSTPNEGLPQGKWSVNKNQYPISRKSLH